MGLKNVEVIEQQAALPVATKKPMSFKDSIKYGGLAVLATAAVNANAALPDIDTTDILTYIGLLVAATATVGAASLMIHLAAKGIKALRTAF